MLKGEKIANKKKLYDAVDLADQCCIVINDKCIALEASNREILSLISMLVDQVKSQTNLTEEQVKEAVELGFLSDEERMQMAIDILTKQFKNTFNGGEEDE